MIELRDRAQKLLYVAGDPTASNPANREPSYTTSKKFWCSIASKTRSEIVKAGKSTDDREITVWYDPRRISFVEADRFTHKGRTYAVKYTPLTSAVGEIEYLEAEAIDK